MQQVHQNGHAHPSNGHEPSPAADRSRTLVLASRSSQLALIQANLVQSSLSNAFPEFGFPITSMATSGDMNQTSPLWVIGGEGKALWTKELQDALLAGKVDAIVHCLKDVPTTLPDGCRLGAVLQREDPRDALVVKKGLPYKTLEELPEGSVVGTGSVRRVAQLRKAYPGLVFSDIRGNLNTRLKKLDAPDGPYSALVLAAAGLVRLSWHARITSYLSSPILFHSVGQGALGVEIRDASSSAPGSRDAKIQEMIESIADWRSTWKTDAERSLLRELEGGCSVPIGVETYFDDEGDAAPSSGAQVVASSPPADSATIPDSGTPPLAPAPDPIPPTEGATLTLKAIVTSLDGQRSSSVSVHRHIKTNKDARALGVEAAEQLRTMGATAILEEVEAARAKTGNRRT